MKVKILIADDNADVRLTLRDLLEDKDYEVVEASNAAETLQQVFDEKPDLLILDIGLPGGKDGYAICKDLRSRPDTQRLPILMLTCWGMPEERTRGLQGGADDYVIKPCDNNELLARIDVLFRHCPPKARFHDRIEHAQHSIEAVETFRRHIVVLNIDVQGASKQAASTGPSYSYHLAIRSYHELVEQVATTYGGMPVAWAGDGGATEFYDIESAVSAGTEILTRRTLDPNVSRLVLRIGITAGSELIDPSSPIGKRTSQTHNRAGHFQKYSSPNMITLGSEVFAELKNKNQFRMRGRVDDETVFEGPC